MGFWFCANLGQCEILCAKVWDVFIGLQVLREIMKLRKLWWNRILHLQCN